MSGKIPTHVGYILDGNRRWAKQHGLPVYEGHMAGYEALRDVIDATADAGVKYISFYSWSTENWNRAKEEVQAVMNLIRRLFTRELKELEKKGYKLVVLGIKDQLPDDILKMIDQVEASSAKGDRATLAVCFNYGGQQEIVRATQRILEQGVKPSEIDEKKFAQYLDHPEVPPCDLIVRTSGEQRLSNFMLWRSAYSEFIFLEKYWPDMRPEDVTAILEEYNNRSRRFGG
ncbi:di-trans,poly-cis-decaprenylcistransferase [Candidatus Saccharibacteria bacterium]|nr:di-trans,poly-cis-decaprenylcistransferase [Candidatus Saccharibacteria bacterium]NCU40247.1 di-trans,poly-cis-decaprenylcistransferase [Candidatus Saccharibacteria bacterium]